MQVGGPASSAGPDAVRDELDDVVEVLSGEIGERCSPARQIEQGVLGPFLRSAFGHDLLSQDVERRHRLDDRV